MYLRLIFIVLLVYLVVRFVKQFLNGGNQGGSTGNKGGPTVNNSAGGKKISDDTGEYVDYEEVKK